MFKVLGIESSCDESSAAIVSSNREILSNVVWSQLAEHKLYKGVVPEIAARSHLHYLEHVIKQALVEAKVELSEVDAIAAASGPGLIGGVIVGTMYGKALSSVLGKPFIAINHLEGHALTARLTHKDLSYPYLLLLVSGGHCQFIAVQEFRKYKILGQTLDDAAGEAFDKTARLLGLNYPGGPIIEQLAKQGDKTRYVLPLSMTNRSGCNMSFSGLKTAIRYLVQDRQPLSQQEVHDFCASFQFTVSMILAKRAENAIKSFKKNNIGANFVVSGGVASNLYIRNALSRVAQEHDFNFIAPPIHLCTDNAAMIAWVGVESLQHGITNALDFCPRARWNLEELTK